MPHGLDQRCSTDTVWSTRQRATADSPTPRELGVDTCFPSFLTSLVLPGNPLDLIRRLRIHEIDRQGTAKFDIDTPDLDMSVA
jgi:hypothetical protein